MTGVWATEPTRQAIFDAIWNRRTIATSAKILVHTEVSGIPMGAEGEISGDPELRVIAESAQRLREIQVFRNGEMTHRESVDGSSLDWTWTTAATPAARTTTTSGSRPNRPFPRAPRPSPMPRRCGSRLRDS